MKDLVYPCEYHINMNDEEADEFYECAKRWKNRWETTPISFHLNLEIIERINDDGVETEVGASHY